MNETSIEATETANAAKGRHRLYWLPNALTVSRIVMIPFLVLGILAPFQLSVDIDLLSGPWLAISIIGIFILCMVTDFLDGYWARKYDMSSDFGRMLDAPFFQMY